MYYVDEKTLMISLFNNSKKLVQILLEVSQQIVEGYVVQTIIIYTFQTLSEEN